MWVYTIKGPEDLFVQQIQRLVTPDLNGPADCRIFPSKGLRYGTTGDKYFQSQKALVGLSGLVILLRWQNGLNPIENGHWIENVKAFIKIWNLNFNGQTKVYLLLIST